MDAAHMHNHGAFVLVSPLAGWAVVSSVCLVVLLNKVSLEPMPSTFEMLATESTYEA